VGQDTEAQTDELLKEHLNYSSIKILTIKLV